jgi:hypothetical protein
MTGRARVSRSRRSRGVCSCIASLAAPPRRLGLTFADLNGRQSHRANGGRASRQIVGTFDYRDETGALLYQVVRYEPKDFRQRRPDGQGGWRAHLGDVRRVLYRLTDLPECKTVLYLEGERHVDAAWALGVPATTHAGGTGGFASYASGYVAQLRALGVQTLVVCPDHDAPGEKLMHQVAAAAQVGDLVVRWLALPDVGEKGISSIGWPPGMAPPISRS